MEGRGSRIVVLGVVKEAVGWVSKQSHCCGLQRLGEGREQWEAAGFAGLASGSAPAPPPQHTTDTGPVSHILFLLPPLGPPPASPPLPTPPAPRSMVTCPGHLHLTNWTPRVDP